MTYVIRAVNNDDEDYQSAIVSWPMKRVHDQR